MLTNVSDLRPGMMFRTVSLVDKCTPMYIDLIISVEESKTFVNHVAVSLLRIVDGKSIHFRRSESPVNTSYYLPDYWMQVS